MPYAHGCGNVTIGAGLLHAAGLEQGVAYVHSMYTVCEGFAAHNPSRTQG